MKENRTKVEADPRASAKDVPSPSPNSLIFMQFSAKIVQNNTLAHRSWELAPPSPPLRKSWIHHCKASSIFHLQKEFSLLCKLINAGIIESLSFCHWGIPHHSDSFLSTIVDEFLSPHPGMQLYLIDRWIRKSRLLESF